MENSFEQIQPMFIITKQHRNKRSKDSISKRIQNKRAYQQIDLWKRKELIDCVMNKHETMKDCSKRLGINYCTAKHILKVYRRTGSYETDLMRKKKERDDELRQRVLNDVQFADYTINEFGYAPSNKESSSRQSSTKEISTLKSDDSNHESTHNVVTENNEEEVRTPTEKTYLTHEHYFRPNFLFENASVEESCTPVDLKTSLNIACRLFGDMVYKKFEF